ncbi:MAG: GGDEF domain-containing protein [Proteobacteria bacterium]|nr:GGDEF domain-containing protein [Pseudomonadota bacterium]
MTQDTTIHLLIIHQHEDEAERILSILRNAQIAVRPSRCIDEDGLNDHLANTRVDFVLIQALQNDLPINTVSQCIKRTGKDIPLVALLDKLDNDSISEVYEAGIRNFCTDNIHEQLCTEVINVATSLYNRRKLRQYEVDLNDVENRCNSLLDNSKDAIAYIHDGMHVYTNNAYLEFFQYADSEEMEITPFLNLVAKEQVDATKKLLRDIAADKMPENDINMQLKTATGEAVEAVVSFDKATVDGEPCVQFLVQPPKVNLEAERELREIRNKDMLTGFYNINYFTKDLNEKINLVKSGKSSGYSILFIQIDKHRELSKDLGKGNFDLLIADIAPYLKETVGEKHLYTRYDDSTYAVIIEGQIEDASVSGQHIIKKITDHLFNAGERTLSCTISVGVTQIIEQTKSAPEVIKLLETELAKATAAGGNQLSIFDPAEEEKKALAANQKWIDLITNGLKNDNFILHYQPIISLQGDETEHYEVLVCLLNGDEIIMPVDFISVAKRHGLIIDIDRQVIQLAIHAIKTAVKDVALFVKVSTDTLSNPSFPTWLAEELKVNGISGEKIIFEVPESELISKSKQVKPVIQSIKSLNCQFAIEKFGSGLNSFLLFKHYPIDFVKIDSIFMQDFAKNEDNQKKVKDIIDQSHAQNKIVVCEFIEDAATMSILWKYSANYVQGNFLAPASAVMIQDT